MRGSILAQSEDRLLPVIVAVPTSSQNGTGGCEQARASRVTAATLVDAHMSGQDGRRRGLKSGLAGIRAAKASYLRTQFAGGHDRRPPPGQVTKVTL